MAGLQNLTKKRLIEIIVKRDKVIEEQRAHWESKISIQTNNFEHRIKDIKQKTDSHIKGMGLRLDSMRTQLNKAKRDLRNSSVMNRALLNYAQGLEEIIDADKE